MSLKDAPAKCSAGLYWRSRIASRPAANFLGLADSDAGPVARPPS